ncbi:MAG: LITAF-like zinc ribbon domain-containing protein [Pyrinomonadaceae bacterium]
MNPVSGESNFCRFCGFKFLLEKPPQRANYDYEPPRPYVWKTDEYQTQSEARPVVQREAGANVQPFSTEDQFVGRQQLTHPDPHYLTGDYRCPHCAMQVVPRIERRISSTGWIVFAVLLVLVFPLFWIGLLIKEDVWICPGCNAKM